MKIGSNAIRIMCCSIKNVTLKERKCVLMALAQLKTYTEGDYYNLPEDIRAELIDGQIYYMSAPSRIHQEILNSINNTIYNYIRSKNGNCKVYPAPFAVKLFQDDDKNIVEPDISVICDPNKLTERGCTGAPDWIIEIVSPTNPSHDYVKKLNLYLDAGVREYWIVDPRYSKIYVYNMESNNFIVNEYSFSDTIKAGIYEDLYIDFPSLDI